MSTSVNLTALPTIEEQATITKQESDSEDKHTAIAEVFPDQQKETTTQQVKTLNIFTSMSSRCHIWMDVLYRDGLDYSSQVP